MTVPWLKRIFPNAIMVEFCGEDFLLDNEGKRLFGHIRTPFWSAGKEFHWDCRTPGLGMNKPALQFAEEKGASICVFVGKITSKFYRADPKEWINFSERTGSVKVKRGVRILVYPWDYCETVYLATLDDVKKTIRGG